MCPDVPSRSRCESEGHELRSMWTPICAHVRRRESGEAALETVELAAELAPRGVVGIDLSGAAAHDHEQHIPV